MNNMTLTTIFDITSFGAVADGRTSCTKAFKEAVEACRKAGGGTVYVPAGVFLTGPIHLCSNMTLYVEAGARVLFSTNKDEYPLLFTRWKGVDGQVYSPLIYGSNLENVAITGRGVIDGQGEYWWNLFRTKELEYHRPRFISFECCNNVLIEGVNIVNSPSWTINPLLSENVTIDKISIKNPADSPNTDGINPESCKNVHISNCHVDVGDDCITIKSGTENCSKKVPCENITISNCTMVHGHGGVVIGSEMSGGVRNVVISNCIFEGTDRGIRIKSRRGRGGVVEDIRIDNIIMKKVFCPFVIHMFYHCGLNGKDKYIWDKKPYPVDEATPIFRRIHFSNITAREVSAAAGFIYGLPEMYIEDVTFDNISVHLARDAEPELPAMMSNLEPMTRKGFYGCNVKDMKFNHVNVDGNEGPAFQIESGDHTEISVCRSINSKKNQPLYKFDNVNDEV